MRASIDFETFSPVNLVGTGVYPYAAHPHTGIYLMAYAFDDEEPELWWPDDPVFPPRLAEHIAAGGELRAWNAQFERIIWREKAWLYGLPVVRDDQWYCTAADAAAMALPRSLDHCAEVTKITVQKDKEGYALMRRICKPLRWSPGGWPIFCTDPELLRRLGEYCRTDVRTEQALYRVTRRLSPSERELYLLDQRMNDRGVMIDRPLVVAARELARQGLEQANATLKELTGTVEKVTQTARIKTWLAEQGVDVPSLNKVAVEKLRKEELTELVREVIDTRAEFGRSSISKLGTMLDVAGADDRARGLTLYHGANTGRWAGRLIQPHNFPRPDVKDVEYFIPAVLRGDYDALDLHAPPLQIISSMLRSCLIAAPGHRLMVADFASIEARVVAWLAGQDDLVEMFRTGGKIYEAFASRVYDKPVALIAKDSVERQVGKAGILGCGFGMGHEKFFGELDKINLAHLGKKFAKQVVDTYRETYPKIPQLWKDLEGAALAAVSAPGSIEHVGRLSLSVRGKYLWLKLPSGRVLAYAGPHIKMLPVPWDEHELRPGVMAWSIQGQSKVWMPRNLYGGLLAENATQAVARDLMATAMLREDAAGYPVILSVHDEVVSEVPNEHGTLEEFLNLMTVVPDWAAGCPVAAEGYEATRYRK